MDRAKTISQKYVDDYEFINLGINEALFDGAYADVSLYLDFEGELLSKVAKNLQCSEEDFLGLLGQTVADTLTWGKNNIYSFHMDRFNEWVAQGNRGLPPFTALLASFSCAAEQMSSDAQFSSSNYYERLYQHLGEPEVGAVNKLQSAGKYTEPFWLALNYWLDETDNIYGRPTARAINTWKYVSYAISQALIREADRQKLTHMFLDFGMAPGEKISEPEMRLYLDEWMSRSTATSWLRTVWSHSDLRDRVTASAVEELANWSGSDSPQDTASSSEKQLFWGAHLSRFPRKSLRLFLGVNGSTEEFCSDFKITEDQSVTVSEAFQATQGKVWFSEYPGIDCLVLDPINQISIGHLLLANFSLRSADSQRSVARVHKPIIVLTKPDGSTSFREVSRVSLNKQFMLLCHQSWVAKVESHLNTFCSSGFEKHDAAGLQGIPAGWVLFSGVVFNSTIVDEIDSGGLEQLAALVPLDDGRGIHLEGGLKLNNNCWHSGFLPTCYANDDSGVIACSLIARSLQGSGAPIAVQEEPVDLNFLSSAVEAQENAQYVIAAQRGRTKYTRDFVVRTADSPRPLKQQMLRSITKGVVSETARASDGAISFCEGLYLTTDSATPDLQIQLSPPIAIESKGATHDSVFDKAQYLDVETAQSSEICALRGYHHWVCEPYDGKRSKSLPVKMNCSGCNVSVLSKGKTKRKKSGKTPSKVKALPVSLPKTLAEVAGRDAIDQAGLFDAVCYRGEGTRRALEQLLSHGDADSLTMLNRIRNLEDLGHIELLSTGDASNAERWSVAHPCLVEAINGDLFLSGFRSKKWLSSLEDLLNTRGYSLSRRSNIEAPDTIKFSGGLLDDRLLELVGDLSDPHGRPLRVARHAALTLCQSLASGLELFGVSPVTLQGESDLEAFNLESFAWEPVKSLTGSGAFRRNYLGAKYFFVDANMQAFQGAPGAVKILAASASQTYLQGYDENRQIFFSLLGADPPKMVRRTLIACSGMAPEIVDGLVCFRDVPATIAKSVFTKLYT